MKISDENIKVLKKFAKSKEKSASNFMILKSCKVCTKKKKNIARARKAQGAQACSKLPWEYAYQRLHIKKGLVGGKNIYPYYCAVLQNSRRILLET